MKACAGQLCGDLQHLFNLSLHLQEVPVYHALVQCPKKDILWHWMTTGQLHWPLNIMKGMERF